MRWISMSRASLADGSIVTSLIGKLARSGLLVLVGLLPAAPASAQITRLPPTDGGQPAQSGGIYPARLPAVGESPELFGLPPETGLETDGQSLWEPTEVFPQRPSAAQPGAWWKLVRKSSFDGAWLAGGGDNGLGIAELKASTTIVVPVPVFGSPLMISPGFGVSLLDRPAGMDIPSELYRVSANIMWMKQHSDRLSLMVGVAPGISSDFTATDGAFRIFGYGAATYQWKPTTQLIFGAAYTGRADIPVLPMAGLIWTPDDDTRLELTLPRPRLARRIHWNGALAANAEDWVYLAGELGGGTYAVRRTAGFDDEMTLRDFRLLVGVERKTALGLTGRAEIGYVFGREIEFDRDTTEYQPSDTVLLRAGFSY